MNPTDWINVSGSEWPSSEIEAAAKQGELAVSKIGKTLLVQRAELDRWLATKRIATAKPVTRPRGGRKATGTAEWMPSRTGRDRGYYVARITMPDGTRKRINLKDTSGNDLTDRERDKLLALQLTQHIAAEVKRQQ